MKITTIAIAAAFAAYAAPSLAAEAPTFASCDASATRQGIDETSGSYKPLMVNCLADPAGPSHEATVQRISNTWQGCEDLAISRGVNVHERRGTEGGEPSAWKQFMDACLAGKEQR